MHYQKTFAGLTVVESGMVVTRGWAGTESREVSGNPDPWALVTIR